MREVTFEIVIMIPCDATDDQIDEWVKYQTGVYGGIKGDNPLCEYDMDAIDATSIN